MLDLFDEVLLRKDYQMIPEETEDQTDDRFILFIKESTNLMLTFISAGFHFRSTAAALYPIDSFMLPNFLSLMMMTQ